MSRVRAATADDHDAIWQIFHEVVRRGDSYVYDPATDRPTALDRWLAPDHHVFVVEREGAVRGTYFLRANQPGLGDHVANAAFMVHPAAQGAGLGRAMGEHALACARALGFRAMQFNLVVSANVAAIALWQRLGFAIVGTVPAVFRHATLGEVDAHIMYRSLVPA